MFKTGQKVEHILNKEYLLVVRVGRSEKHTSGGGSDRKSSSWGGCSLPQFDDNNPYVENAPIKENQYLCRTKDFREIWFYDFELTEARK